LWAGGLPKGLNILGLLVGMVGIISIIPVLTEMMVGIFGLSQMIWFIWLGIVMLRWSPVSATEKPVTQPQPVLLPS
jgi:hypothetical protein